MSSPTTDDVHYTASMVVTKHTHRPTIPGQYKDRANVQDGFDKTEEVMSVTLRDAELDGLKGKMQAHTALVDE